jgi:hypothetical protein
MKLFLVITTLISLMQLIASAIRDSDVFDEAILVRAYYGRLNMPTAEDAVR